MSSIVLASNRVINGMRALSKNKSIGFQNNSIPRLKRYGQISPGRHISTVARYIPSYRPALMEACHFEAYLLGKIFNPIHERQSHNLKLQWEKLFHLKLLKQVKEGSCVANNCIASLPCTSLWTKASAK